MKSAVDIRRCVKSDLLGTVFTGLLVAMSMLVIAACGQKKTEQPAADAEKDKPAAATAAKEKEALDTAIDAYIYAYPMVTV